MAQQRHQLAIAAFDKANAEDPNRELDSGNEYPKELLYAMRMTNMLEHYLPEASETLRLSVRAQHIQRWKIPRSDFTMNRQGYLQWRSSLYHFHAELTGDLMRSVGYDEKTISRVQANISKKGLKTELEAQQTEDVASLVFIQHYMHSFATNHPEYDEDKWLKIIHKTWRKMSPCAHDFVLEGKIQLPESLVPLILKAIQTE